LAVGAATFCGGWIMAFFKGVTENDIMTEKPTLLITFRDVVAGTQHSFGVALDKKEPGINIPGIPEFDK
jgi:hypothetical protein